MIYVIVPFHNDEQRLEKFIACLNAQIVKPYVLWIDAGSTDKSVHKTLDYVGFSIYLQVSPKNYWAGSIKEGLTFLSKLYLKSNDIVGIMNNDVTFDDTYFAIVEGTTRYGVLVSSAIYDGERHVQNGVQILWHDYLSRDKGVIPTISVCQHPYHAFPTFGIFLTDKDSRKIKLYPKLLPHYASDYVLTYKLLKSTMFGYVPKQLKLYVDFSTTGITPQKIKEIFHIRYSQNPIYLINYVLLCCPLKYKLQNIIRVLGYTLVRIWRILYERS